MVMLTHRGDGRGARAAAFEHLGPLQYASLQNRKSDCDSLSKMHVMYFLAHPYPIKPPAFGGPSLAGLTAEASPAPRPSPVTLYPVEPPECCASSRGHMSSSRWILRSPTSSARHEGSGGGGAKQD
eukprot:scaffold106979_cov62-Phaeocystis_antarctica.AAC.5